MNIAEIKKRDVANGTGVRVAVFVAGCRHHCKGCFNAEAWDFGVGQEFNNALETEIIELCRPSFVSGISVLGGEPLEPENQQGVLALVKGVKSLNKSVWLYTGFCYEELTQVNSRANTTMLSELLSNVDVLVDGRFELDKKNISLAFRGSENQRIIDLPATLKQNKITLYEL